LTEPADRRSGVWVVAHRGASRDRPENTLASFDEALRQGCDGIELDLRISADGIPVVFHDDDLSRFGWPKRRVEELSMAEIEELRAAPPSEERWPGGEPFPALREVLERYLPRTRLLLELKGSLDESRNRSLVRAAVAMLREAGAGEGVFILSFHYAMLRSVASLEPGLARVLNLRPASRLERALRDRLPSLSALSTDVRGLTPAFGREVTKAGCPLWSWTCNTGRQVDRALQAGASAIISDRPAWAADYLRGRLR
jgi:glycerophosphoryl diester phosphodiesterase